jgi:hypothetical protein
MFGVSIKPRYKKGRKMSDSCLITCFELYDSPKMAHERSTMLWKTYPYFKIFPYEIREKQEAS